MFRPLPQASWDWQAGQAVVNPVCGEYEKLYWWLEIHTLIDQAQGDTDKVNTLMQVQNTLWIRRDELWSEVGQP